MIVDGFVVVDVVGDVNVNVAVIDTLTDVHGHVAVAVAVNDDVNVNDSRTTTWSRVG